MNTKINCAEAIRKATDEGLDLSQAAADGFEGGEFTNVCAVCDKIHKEPIDRKTSCIIYNKFPHLKNKTVDLIKDIR